MVGGVLVTLSKLELYFVGHLFSSFQNFKRGKFSSKQGLEISLLHFLLYMCQTTFVIRKERN